jgi:phosphoribosylglycinamide formyltransferase-1
MKGVILISGNGSNLQSLIESSVEIKLDIACVISNVSSAFGLQRAKQAGIIGHVLDNNQFHSRDEFDSKLSELIDTYSPEIIILAGFMRILTPDFTKKYLGKIINIHPSLLPKFQGLHTHDRALNAKEKKHGVSVHFVTEELDGGPIIAQSVVDILESDDADSLARRVLSEEHKIFPKVVSWYTHGRLKLHNNQASLDNTPI